MPDRRAPHAAAARVAVGLRLMILSTAALAAVGFIGRPLDLVTLTTTLGPTAYVLVAHPRHSVSRLPVVVVGHAVAVGLGLLSVAVFGLWHHPSVVATASATPRQVWAQALAVGCTLLVLSALRAHHAPAAATALLISSGIIQPGRPLVGLVVGLAMVIVLAALLAKLPGWRAETSRQQ